MSIRSVYDSFISQPAIYRFQTRLLGRKRLDAQLTQAISEIVAHQKIGIIIDVGGGTAQTRRIWPLSWTYISIDPDERMVELTGNDQIDRRIGSASCLPLADKSADVVLLQNMSHHLDDDTWIAAIDEAFRVLKTSGKLVFMDAIICDTRWLSRLFWKFDAGHFPRRSEILERDISRRFTISDIRRFTMIHHVIVVTAIPS